MEGGAPEERSSVAVIVTTFNHARYLADAISSVLSQTRPADDVIVVDDGSTDDPDAVVNDFSGVRMIRQENRGLASARNTGLRNCTTSHVVFLDADDRLCPQALEAGLACAAKRPECAFVYGGHRFVSENGNALGADRYDPISGDAHLAFLQGNPVVNPIAMHATVLYRRDCLIEIGGFDEALRRCEDYDLYLRIAQKYPVSSHQAIVAEYRLHKENMSADAKAQLRTVLAVLDRHERRIVNARERIALQKGRAAWKKFYVSQMLSPARARSRGQKPTVSLQHLTQAALWSPGVVLRFLIRDQLTRLLPPAIVRRIQRLRGRADSFPLGSVNFGDLRRLSPISTFGFDRGTPVDRYYVERFLTKYAANIRGRVLEAGDNAYTLRFGGSCVERSDILHLDGTNPRATLIGDLQRLDVLPEGVFDCIVLTQTLHFLFDMRAGVATLHRALKPGGVLLLTAPGITQVDCGTWGSKLAWSLTATAARRLLEERFQSDSVIVEAHGNVLAATAFLYGLAVEELKCSDLDVDDPNFPVIVAARATKTGTQ
jgi:glycosyltransferase involved in cell wall biosynthesis